MKKVVVALPLLALLLGPALPGRATVETSKKEKKPCTVCHVKMGSKELNAAGEYYKQHRTLAGYPPAPAAKPAPPPPPPPAAPAAQPAPAAPPEPAPPQPARRRLVVYRHEVDPPQFQAYEDALRAWVEAAQQTQLGETFSWSITQNGFTYWVFQPLADFRLLDPSADLTQARLEEFTARLGAERIAQITARGRPAIRRSESWVIESLPEYDYTPEGWPADAQARFAHVDIERVRLERVADYEALLARLKEILARSKYPCPVRFYRALVGPENTYFIGFVARDAQELYDRLHWTEEVIPQTIGAEAFAQLLAQWAACLAEFEHFDETLRPDLSYRPAPPAAPEEKK